MNKRLLLGATLLTIASFAMVWIFTLPAPVWSKDLSITDTANIATSISGLTSPLLTIISIYFLFIAFTKQKEGNDIQTQKNEFDKLITLFIHAKDNLDKFSIRGNYNGSPTEYVGQEGFSKWINTFAVNDQAHFQMFLNSFRSDDVIYIISTFKVLKNSIERSSLDKHRRDEIIALYNAFVKSHLLHPINVFMGKFEHEKNHEIISLMREVRGLL